MKPIKHVYSYLPQLFSKCEKFFYFLLTFSNRFLFVVFIDSSRFLEDGCHETTRTSKNNQLNDWLLIWSINGLIY